MSAVPGPWTIVDNRSMNGALWIEAPHPEGFNVSIAEVRQGCEEADEISDLFSNAHLIAAAPRLLSALKKMIAPWDGYSIQRLGEITRMGELDCSHLEAIIIARAAINEAEAPQ